MANKIIVQELLKELVTDLSLGNYKNIIKTGRNGRLTEKEIVDAISEYPGKISLPDNQSFLNYHQYDYNDNPDECAIEFDLWFDNKKSDLTLRGEIVRDNKGKYQIKIQDILVM